ncbi:HNH endonuclease [Chloroflexota bacterium]
MPKRFEPKVRLWVYRYLCKRDGEWCKSCGCKPTRTLESDFSGVVRHPKHVTLDIHHIDGNAKNNNPSNLILLCHRCNTSISNKQRAGKSSVSCVRDNGRERWEGKVATRIARQQVNYASGDASMQANGLYEVPFREWVLLQVRNLGFIAKRDAINAGAETVGCSTQTARRYLDKLTSYAGPLCEEKDLLGEMMLTWQSYLGSVDAPPIESAEQESKTTSRSGDNPTRIGEKR